MGPRSTRRTGLRLDPDLEVVDVTGRHLPGGLDVEEASKARIRSAEHLGPGVALLACCSSHGDAGREPVRAKRSSKVPYVPVVSSLLERAALDALLDKAAVAARLLTGRTDQASGCRAASTSR